MASIKQQTNEQPKAANKDVYTTVTNTLIEQLEKGIIPWQKPWTGGDHPPFSIPSNFVTGNKYRGINIVLLWSAAIKNNYKTDDWASFKQWQDKKETIRKGEKGNLVVYYDTFEKQEEDEIKKIPFLKTYYVFNRCQLTSYVEPVNSNDHQPIDVYDFTVKIDTAEEFIENTEAVIKLHDQGACYIPSLDTIRMPHPERFISTATSTATEAFYSTLFHELTHWTGSESRLNRTKGKSFGDQNYAHEELVAEFGAAFLCAGFGLANLEKGDHAGYIDHWLKVLREDNRCIFKAASDASKAADYLYSLQPDPA